MQKPFDRHRRPYTAARVLHRRDIVVDRRTGVAEQDGKEDEAVSGAEHDDAEVDAKVEDLEELRFGEGEHDDAEQLRDADPAEDLKQRKGPD